MPFAKSIYQVYYIIDLRKDLITLNERKLIQMDIIRHILCYLISYVGLFLFLFLFDFVFELIPGFKTLNEADSLIIKHAFAYGFTVLSLAIFLWNSVLKQIINQFKVLKNILMGIIFGMVLVGGTYVFSYISSLIASAIGIDFTDNANQKLIEEGTMAQPVFAALMSILFAPISEEIGYRLGIFGGISKYKRIWAYVATSLIFAFIHFDFTSAGDSLIIELLNLPSYIFAGAWLCFCYDYEGNISTSITAHMFNNLMAFIMQMVG